MLHHSRKLASYFALFPLTVFVLYAFWGGQPDVNRFKVAFTLGGTLAAIQLVWTLYGGNIVDRTVLGVNLYLVIGALCFYLDWVQLGQTYDHLRETGVVLAITFIGAVTTLLSPYGFVGAVGPRSLIIKNSAALLAVALIGCVLSFTFRGQLLISAAVPIIAIQMTRRMMLLKLYR